jgi:hypothetical protein
MKVWKLKSCPRCSGDLYVQCEMDSCYEECLLCGYERDISNLNDRNPVGRVKMNDPIEARRKL